MSYGTVSADRDNGLAVLETTIGLRDTGLGARLDRASQAIVAPFVRYVRGSAGESIALVQLRMAVCNWHRN
jgi:hypothetical protein